jgi:hypothetical protein
MMIWLRLLFLVTLLTVAWGLTPAPARDLDGRYANAPDRDWYERAELTEAAKQRFGFKSCCKHSEVFRTQFRVNKDSGDDEWWYLTPDRKWKRIPDDIIHWGETAPGGLPTLFIYNGQETCFWPGESGG